MSEKNMQIVRSLLEEVWTRGNLSLLPELVAENAESHPMPNFGALHGPEEYRNFIAVYKGAFHDMAFTIEDQFDSGDKVATRWTSRVTDVAGDAVSDEQTGEQLTIDGTTITHHDSSGKITGEWATWDTGSLLQSAAAPHIFEQLSISI
jgi:ketosteroid isomerase-like protein